MRLSYDNDSHYYVENTLRIKSKVNDCVMCYSKSKNNFFKRKKYN